MTARGIAAIAPVLPTITAVAARFRADHTPLGPYCTSCGEPWPCLTARFCEWVTADLRPTAPTPLTLGTELLLRPTRIPHEGTPVTSLHDIIEFLTEALDAGLQRLG